ncbi:UDP-glucose 4-epimerase GalE [Arthrobacter sp. MYb229]|uniref:UDP-glucose 4-epimerase GalE n=1 Tax=unclassified Arthrobacter TaxID=235627 RepID=UPI000CFE254D|nr:MULTISPECIES: UDP-glucose 4-epimerase GalE [unclassified Arthrobacter]PRA06977.1 UDP-glucose 4-epimerase GalE [Arthrobacter sp. MYb229]PRB47925.1 UDP-glucose 4-epimerase GalE [Arthrobacter sp. MYb216]
MRILVTGGAGYIGSHTVLLLLQEGHQVSVIDNFSNSSPESLRRVVGLAGRTLDAYQIDLLDAERLTQAIGEIKPEAVIHFAGLKAVGESVAQPLKYYENNVVGTLNLLEAMNAAECRTIVFSSSATVYGDSTDLPLREDTRRSATNPYGRTKLHIEEMLEELAVSDSRWRIANLRYFNPVGAHESGLIGEDPQGIPNNLMPFVAQVAIGKRVEVQVFGGDYSTADGTGVRDYIHVLDLASGHLAALDYLSNSQGVHVWNLGTGAGSSVLEVIDAFARISGRPVPYRITGRRPGDVAESYAHPEKARLDLGWKAERGLEQMVADMWNWQSNNPDGFPEADHQLIKAESLQDFICGSSRTVIE